jgi:hypothetical protein
MQIYKLPEDIFKQMDFVSKCQSAAKSNRMSFCIAQLSNYLKRLLTNNIRYVVADGYYAKTSSSSFFSQMLFKLLYLRWLRLTFSMLPFQYLGFRSVPVAMYFVRGTL